MTHGGDDDHIRRGSAGLQFQSELLFECRRHRGGLLDRCLFRRPARIAPPQRHIVRSGQLGPVDTGRRIIACRADASPSSVCPRPWNIERVWKA